MTMLAFSKYIVGCQGVVQLGVQILALPDGVPLRWGLIISREVGTHG